MKNYKKEYISFLKDGQFSHSMSYGILWLVFFGWVTSLFTHNPIITFGSCVSGFIIGFGFAYKNRSKKIKEVEVDD